MSQIATLPSKEAYQSALHRTLSIRDQDALHPLTLVQVKTMIDTPRQHCFSLLFSLAPELDLKQDNYEIVDAQLGTHSLFMVPVKRDADGLYLEAVFNLMR